MELETSWMSPNGTQLCVAAMYIPLEKKAEQATRPYLSLSSTFQVLMWDVFKQQLGQKADGTSHSHVSMDMSYLDQPPQDSLLHPVFVHRFCQIS